MSGYADRCHSTTPPYPNALRTTNNLKEEQHVTHLTEAQQKHWQEQSFLLLTLHPVHLANLANPASGSEERHIPVPTDVVPPYDYVENDNVDFGFTR